MSSTESFTMTISSLCNHDYACQCSIRAEYAELPLLVDELSPQWLLKSFDDEDDNKAIAAEMATHRWRYRIKELRRGFNYMRINYVNVTARYPEIPPDVRPFRWMISYHILPKGYQYGQKGQQPPWRMLVRCMLVDLPSQLSRQKYRESIKLWKKYITTSKEPIYNRTELDDAPPNITCGKRVIFSPQRKNSNRTLCGNWLVVVYLWASDRPWVQHLHVLNLLSFSNIFCIQGWECADAIKAPTKIPYLFYELKKGEDGMPLANDGRPLANNGLPYKDHDIVSMHTGDRVPERLSALRCLMGTYARELL